MVEAFLFSAIGTLGYAITYNIPKKLLPLAAFTGGCGWLVFSSFPESPVMGCFIAAMAVGILSETFSRVFKDAATLFILPGILPLVPGARMYRMTLALLDKDFEMAASLAIEVLSFAGSIAIALLVVTSFTRYLFKCIRLIKLHQMKRKLKKKKKDEKTKEISCAPQPHNPDDEEVSEKQETNLDSKNQKKMDHNFEDQRETDDD